MLYTIGLIQRKWHDFIGFFTGKSRKNKTITILKEKLGKQEKKVIVYSKELEKYKAFELYDQLQDSGDPFPLLASLEPDSVYILYIEY